MLRNITLFCFISFTFSYLYAQKGTVIGSVYIQGKPTEFVTIHINGTNMGTSTDINGSYTLDNIPYGIHTLKADMVGMESKEQEIHINASQSKIKVDFELEEIAISVNEVVVTGTKTFKRKTDSPVIVNILDSKTLENLQVCNLSEGLKFQPGLRVETDCQTCGYTQLRMNGLAGGYSQILINGRPIFSPLMSLYGMEQLPINMIDRIEVLRGGGSTLYGSSAIAGTVNVITKIPKKSHYELSSTFHNINGKTNDLVLNGNTTWVNDAKNAGVSFFMNHRDRAYYDHNGDNFSELPQLKSTSIGTNVFLKPTANQKLELSLSKLNEYRYGGEMTDKPAYLTLQSEERNHDIWLGSADYQINFNDDKSAFITYGAWQNTKRTHYTGVFPDEVSDIQTHIANPPYGTSDNLTLQGGFQLNHKLTNFLGGSNVLTLGTEYISDKILDNIPAYRYHIDQLSRDWGTFLQSDWEILPSLNFLSGVRMDRHNLINDLLFSPRLALLYKHKTTQFRLGYGTGFRAPQAFDTDLHIAFAGGGVSRVQLDDNLTHERSQSLSASINYDKTTDKYIVGFTLESFYTRLDDAFVLENIGNDAFGEIFEKRNGSGATVQGITLELRGNYNKKVQLETGYTLQNSAFAQPVTYIEEVAPITQFVRTPNHYGFANLNLNPNKKWAINLNYVYTGTMKVVHFGGADNFKEDVIIDSNPFSEISGRVAYTIHLHNKYGSDIEVFGGVKNIFNAYQNDFDIGKNRDSNYVYGPGMPRTFFVGVKVKAE
ncbi:MAG: TonB-dependent receptor [Saprospiraceae bacterium]|nr:TonB-dependent receptor [Saprospiraceae bacterium]